VRAERFLRNEGAAAHHVRAGARLHGDAEGPDHVFTLTNQAYLDLVGQRDVVGQDRCARRCRKPSRKALSNCWTACTRAARPIRQRRAVHHRRHRRHAGARAFPRLCLPAGARRRAAPCYGIFVQGADVTDRVLAEQAWCAPAKPFRTLAQALPNQVWAAPPDGVLDWFNERVYSYSGAPGRPR
jgi:PAS domain-containing protein